ncbi:MAG: Hsp20 family protein, partial [Bacilli bacterium]|nr:Hsp20 family protein [Bacilli bacterium]
INASMDNGILSITVPKEESEEPEKKYIEIK